MMRTAVVLGVLLMTTGPAFGQRKEPPPPPRYGVEADLDIYPQDSPKAALTSVVKAIDDRRLNYLAAQLADPATVDKRVAESGGRFYEYVRIVTDRFSADPDAVRALRRLARGGEVKMEGDTAVVSHKDVKGKDAFLRKIGTRWYLEDRQKSAKQP
jgi:hypothetical protein